MNVLIGHMQMSEIHLGFYRADQFGSVRKLWTDSLLNQSEIFGPKQRIPTGTDNLTWHQPTEKISKEKEKNATSLQQKLQEKIILTLLDLETNYLIAVKFL